MMKFYTSLLLLVNVFISQSNGDSMCVSGSGNYALFGNYALAGTYNDAPYYKEENSMCDDRYLFKMGGKWWIGTSLGGGLNVRCETENINSPADCTAFSGVVTAITNTACPEIILTDTCESITISGRGSTSIDGSYNKMDDGLYKKSDGSSTYFSYWNGGREFVTNSIGDVRCGDASGSTTRLDASLLSAPVVGESQPVSTIHPAGSTITILCNSAAVSSGGSSTPSSSTSSTSSQAPAPVSGLGSVCFGITYTGTLTSNSGTANEIETVIANVAGEYIEIANINNKPAYQLQSSCEQTNPSYYIIYVGEVNGLLYNRYMLVQDPSSPITTRIMSCTNFNTITNNDITQCEWGTLNDYITVSSEVTGAACRCGLTPTPRPTDAPVEPVAGLGSICFVTEVSGTLDSNSGISTVLADLAGEYTEIDNINGRPAYQLSSTCSGVASSTLMYVKQNYNDYMFVRDVSNPTTSYYFACDNTDTITNNDITQCSWGNEGNLNSLISVSSTGSSSCQCGLPTPAPTPPVPLASGNLCFAATAPGTATIGGISFKSIAGQFASIGDINGRPAYQLITSCSVSPTAYIVYNSNYETYDILTDINNPNSFISYCTNTGSITNNDVTQCSWLNAQYFTVTDTIPSCPCQVTI